MWFWWFMLFINLLTPTCMIVFGRLMWKHWGKMIHSMIGYRTTRSMRNMETWSFAHDYCGKLWWKLGWLMLMPSALALIPFIHASDYRIGVVGLIICTIQCIILIISIIITERALRTEFGDG